MWITKFGKNIDVMYIYITKTNSMIKILKETRNRIIYMQLNNGFYTRTTRKSLIETLVAMKKCNEGYEKIELNTAGTENMIWINFNNK